MLRLVVVSVVSTLVFDAGLLRAQSRTAYQAVDTIRVDSLMREAPVSSMSELLNSRLTGVHVTQNEGVTGGDIQLQIRAPNSLYGNSGPIVIVDGARYTATAWTEPNEGGVVGAGATSPLNDLDPNDVELIEVMKGPSAAALYGAGGANGVILITTKQGRVGPPRWNIHARRRSIDIPEGRELVGYRAWGRSTFTDTPMNCTLANRGTCVTDSLTVVSNPLPILRPSTQADGWMYGGNMMGGTEATQYYFGANVDDANGFSVLQPFEDEPRIGDYGITRFNLRANVATRLGHRGNFRFNAGYLHGAADGSDGVPVRAETNERTRRLLGSIVGQYRLSSWLVARGTLGYDRGRRTRATLSSVISFTDSLIRNAGLDSVMQQAVTADVAVAATARKGRLTARTTLGGERVAQKAETHAAIGAGLPAGSMSPSDGREIVSTWQYVDRSVRGLYLDETLSLNERLFLSAGLRSEWANFQGADFDAEVLPRAGASWLVSGEPWMRRVPGVNHLQLRYAYGATAEYSSGSGLILLPFAMPLVSAGSSLVEPERVSEHEFGVEIGGLGNRVRLELTRYSRRAKDQLVRLALPSSVNGGKVLLNAGSMSQRGFEAQLQLRALDTRWLSWSVLLQHATNETEVDNFDPSGSMYSPTAGYVGGYPLGAIFRPGSLAYVDVNSDGVLQPEEIQVTGPEYIGEPTPRRWQTLGSIVGMFARRLRLSAMLERRSGNVRWTRWQAMLCSMALCRAGTDPSASLEEQAEYMAIQTGYRQYEESDLTSLREVSASLDLPTGITRALRGRSMTLTLAARNLALWTDFTSGNPETGDDWSSGRSWMLRLDVDL